MTTQRTLARTALAMGAALAVMVVARPAAAQDVDPRWLPWIGCWEPATAGSGIDLLCVQPAEEAGAVEFLRIADSEVLGREVLRADGRRHETTRESCTGWEEGTFSEDGRRLFVTGAYTCEGATQETTTIVSMSAPHEWLDVRVAGMGGERVAWVQRYRVASALQAEAAGFGDILAGQAWSVATARMMASAPLDVDDVIEASVLAPAEAVQALLAERQDRLDLTASELIRMADAGISDEVIDVAVAVSFPDQFRLNTGPMEDVQVSALDEGSLRRRWVGGPYASAFYDPFYMPWSLRYGIRAGWYGYDPYGYGYGYGGYGGYGYYGGYPYGYRPTVVVVDQVGPDREHGRVVNGRGYSRGGSGGTSRSSGGAVAPSRAPAAGTGASSGTTTKSSGSTGRTAKPRGGGQ